MAFRFTAIGIFVGFGGYAVDTDSSGGWQFYTEYQVNSDECYVKNQVFSNCLN